ncbi:MAG: elongation factor P [Erysipelotrichaceae bacterium]|nr:elongation factor P [Erysipelotrichaceae bacterium]MBQ4253841.1 elongation factor P [Erysipelotrichaceae bacterium]MBQ7223454.1 elongation factor P [Erysipelotrichaceae bacterium]
MILVNDLKPGTTFIYEGNLYITLSTSLNKTAMRQMVVKAHAKDLRTGTIKDVVFTGGDKVEPAAIEKKEMQYLYDAGDELVFMDNATYDQIEIPKANLTWELNFLKPNDNVSITSYESEILGIQLPDKVALQIVEVEGAVKGDTATSASKNAVLETGWNVKVPLFIEQDEVILVSTIDGKYCGRA